ncbi:kinase-like domain-containing protein [Aspergillus californicus]
MAPEEGEIIHELFKRKVVRVGDTFARKYGPNLRAHEPDNLRFIAANTTIPVPKVHDVEWEDGKLVSFTMDYMPGTKLDDAWDSLDHDQKLSIAKQLHGYVAQLRKLKGTYIGGVNGTAVIGKMFRLECGPFDTEQAFNKFILQEVHDRTPDILRELIKEAVLDTHEIVFTHSDLAPRNILVENGQVTAILDWEDAGWYPEYWESFRALRQLRPVPDWPEYLPLIIPPGYGREYIGMNFVEMISKN